MQYKFVFLILEFFKTKSYLKYFEISKIKIVGLPKHLLFSAFKKLTKNLLIVS